MEVGSSSPFKLLGLIKTRSNSIELTFKSTSLVLPASLSVGEIEDLMELANKFEEEDEEDDDDDEDEDGEEEEEDRKDNPTVPLNYKTIEKEANNL